MDGLHKIKTTKKINTLAFDLLYLGGIDYLMQSRKIKIKWKKQNTKEEATII